MVLDCPHCHRQLTKVIQAGQREYDIKMMWALVDGVYFQVESDETQRDSGTVDTYHCGHCGELLEDADDPLDDWIESVKVYDLAWPDLS